MNISEEVLHHIWKYRLYKTRDLKTKNGRSLQVKFPGEQNKHAGPDFEHSRLFIEQTEWAGNVEIHIKSSHWYKHNHQHNPAYNNVILHVVYEDDMEIVLADGTTPETLELKSLINMDALNRYHELMVSKAVIPCQQHLAFIDSFHITQWLDRLLIERLSQKAQLVDQLLTHCLGSWEEVTYILLARNFGYKVNALPFERLAKSLPYKLLRKYDQPLFIESLLFGQAGMLDEEFVDEYPKVLQNTYCLLRRQHQLKPIDVASWKFLRMRPLNFPTIRLAQFSAWCSRTPQIFAKLISIEKVCDLRKLFEDLAVNTYWENHFKFDVATKKHGINLGETSIDNILLNTVVTILFSYGKYIGKEAYICRAIDLLEELSPERNAIVTQYKQLGVEVKTAAHSQALLQLRKAYCDKVRCLDCSIGLQIFKQNKTL